MSIQLYIGYTGEGTTDKRFLVEIISNTFAEVALDCRNDISIEEIVLVNVEKNKFVEMMTEASKKTFEEGLSVLCIHADADKKTSKDIYANKFTPLFDNLSRLDNKLYCKNIVPIIPIIETESWMLADKELLKARINAKGKTNSELGIERQPESYADPKTVIENAIRLAQQDKPKRRQNLKIADLYEELGQAIKLDQLRTIPSFRDFENNVRRIFIQLGYLQ